MHIERKIVLVERYLDALTQGVPPTQAVAVLAACHDIPEAELAELVSQVAV